jgi:hypothetical protein
MKIANEPLALPTSCAVHSEHRVDIGHRPAPVHHLAAALDKAFEHRLEVIDLDLDGRTPLLWLQDREQRGAHAGVGQREQGRAVHGALGVEVHRLHLQRQQASALGAFGDPGADMVYKGKRHGDVVLPGLMMKPATSGKA